MVRERPGPSLTSPTPYRPWVVPRGRVVQLFNCMNLIRNAASGNYPDSAPSSKKSVLEEGTTHSSKLLLRRNTLQKTFEDDTYHPDFQSIFVRFPKSRENARPIIILVLFLRLRMHALAAPNPKARLPPESGRPAA